MTMRSKQWYSGKHVALMSCPPGREGTSITTTSLDCQPLKDKNIQVKNEQEMFFVVCPLL